MYRRILVPVDGSSTVWGSTPQSDVFGGDQRCRRDSPLPLAQSRLICHEEPHTKSSASRRPSLSSAPHRAIKSLPQPSESDVHDILRKRWQAESCGQ